MSLISAVRDFLTAWEEDAEVDEVTAAVRRLSVAYEENRKDQNARQARLRDRRREEEVQRVR